MIIAARSVTVTGFEMFVTDGAVTVTDSTTTITDCEMTITDPAVTVTDGEAFITDCEMPVTARFLPLLANLNLKEGLVRVISD